MQKNSIQPAISFIIPCYKCRRTVGFTLKAVFNQTTNRIFEVLLIDSTPGGVFDWVRTTYPRVKIISSEKRLGAGAARNLGVEQATGEFIAFLDADVVPFSGWLESLMTKLENNRAIQIAGGSIANANPESIASRILHWIEFSEFLPGLKSGPRKFLSSSNLLIRKDDFLNSGGFSLSFSMSEDLEMFSKKKLNIYFESSALIRHFHRSRWHSSMEHLFALGYWSGVFRKGAPESVQGSWLKHLPILSWFLVPYRLVRILSRIWSHSIRDGIRALIHLPLILLALVHWTRGFFSGIRGKELKT